MKFIFLLVTLTVLTLAVPGVIGSLQALEVIKIAINLPGILGIICSGVYGIKFLCLTGTCEVFETIQIKCLLELQNLISCNP